MVRHNDIRNLLYHLAQRGRLGLELEKVELRQDDALVVNLRCPVDVLVDGGVQAGGIGANVPARRFAKTVWDVKIN